MRPVLAAAGHAHHPRHVLRLGDRDQLPPGHHSLIHGRCCRYYNVDVLDIRDIRDIVDVVDTWKGCLKFQQPQKQSSISLYDCSSSTLVLTGSTTTLRSTHQPLHTGSVEATLSVELQTISNRRYFHNHGDGPY